MDDTLSTKVHPLMDSQDLSPSKTGNRADYHHAPFRWSDEIRLLKVHSRIHGEELTAELVHVRLGDHPGYEAVSYTWANASGDATLCREIVIQPGQRRISITKNCNCALRRFRLQESERMLWIDAVCIDQTNDRERSHQVRRMTEIYRNAERVLIYLFPGIGLQSIARLQRLFGRIEREGLFGIIVKGVPSEGETDLMYLLQNAWFRRIWVIQEVVMAKVATVFCGPCHVDWEHFAMDATDNRDDNLITPVPSPHLDSILPPVLRIRKRRSPRSTDFTDLLFATRSCKATEPRDKVYALLWCGEDGRLRNIVPDYTRTVAQVFREATSHCISSTGSLKVLSLIQEPLSTAETWVPDLAPRTNRPLLSAWRIDLEQPIPHDEVDTKTNIPQVSCEPDALASISYPSSSPRGLLNVRGHRQGVVQHGVSCNDLSIFNPKTSMSDFEPEFRAIISRYSDIHVWWTFLHCSRRHEVLSTLPADWLEGNHNIPLDLPEAAKNHLYSKPYLCQPKLHQFFNLIYRFGTNRNVILTNTGIGIGPGSAQSGDEIVRFKDTETPLVIRRKGKTHATIGECVLVKPSLHGTCRGCNRSLQYNSFCGCEACVGCSRLREQQHSCEVEITLS